MTTSSGAERRLRQLAEVLEDKRRLLVLTHDNPDPDSIASGWALTKVVRKIGKLQADLAYAGIIGRSENRTLTRILRVPLRPLDSVSLADYDAFALVDSQPQTGNNSLPEGVVPTIVIDHHPCRDETRKSPFYDVREDYGAAASMLAEYLTAAEVKVDRRLATAMFYAIKTETLNLGREAARADTRAFVKFFALVDNEALSQIENPPISRAYFRMVDQAIAGTHLHGDVAVTRFGDVNNPDMVAQFADLMVRMEKVHWALTMGRFKKDLLLSIRTNLPTANAGRIIQQVVAEDGKAGGHGMMAGGKVSLEGMTPARIRDMETQLKHRALDLLGAKRRGSRLVAARKKN